MPVKGREASRVQDAVVAIRRVTWYRPRAAIVLGSGLGGLANEVANPTAMHYGEIPGFPIATAPGHEGKLFLGELSGYPVAVLSGRAHLYEGCRPQDVVLPVRVMKRLGADTLIVTNAAGGVNVTYAAGSLMLISDHINLTGSNPLIGPPEPELGVRFPDMTEAYSPRLRELARQAADRTGVPLEEGVYMALAGPSYETPAEIRMTRTLGADAVGMSTVMEVIAANHVGMEVLGISCITNAAAGILPQTLSEEEVIETAARAAGAFSALIRGILTELGEVVE